MFEYIENPFLFTDTGTADEEIMFSSAMFLQSALNPELKEVLLIGTLKGVNFKELSYPKHFGFVYSAGSPYHKSCFANVDDKEPLSKVGEGCYA